MQIFSFARFFKNKAKSQLYFFSSKNRWMLFEGSTLPLSRGRILGKPMRLFDEKLSVSV